MAMDTTTMDTKSISLNERLAHTSKKFYKSCEQIKLIKQRIGELINVFKYCDQELATIDCGELEREPQSPEQRSNHLSIFKESIRQEIENLQCIKTAYFVYAHRKADEITKLQCELFGEEAVREAYEQAEPDVLMPVVTPTSEQTSSTSDQSAQENHENLHLEHHHSTDDASSNWTPWNFNQYYLNNFISSYVSNSNSTESLYDT